LVMARIKIKDLPEDSRISDEEAKKAFGGAMVATGGAAMGNFERPGLAPQMGTSGRGGVERPDRNMIQIAGPPGGGKVPGQAAMPSCTDTCW
jgi:hypothetical protein